MQFDRDGRTRVEITTLYPSHEARDPALAAGMTGGMDLGFGRLDEHLGAW